MNYQEAIRAGALAFFGDKYGDRVRVVKIGGFSTELCGGTHVERSGEIGLFKLPFESGVAAGVRRVEAFTGEGALELVSSYEQRLKEIGTLVRGSADDAVDKVKKLLERQKELEKEIEKLRGQFGKDQIPELLDKKQSVDGANILVSRVDGLDAKQLRDIADQITEKLGSGVVVLASAGECQCQFSRVRQQRPAQKNITPGTSSRSWRAWSVAAAAAGPTSPKPVAKSRAKSPLR